MHPGSLSLYVHYGQSRPKDAKSLAQNDVVITTYGILASEFSSEVVETCILPLMRLFISSLKTFQLVSICPMYRMQMIMVDSSQFGGLELFLMKHIP